MLDRSHIGILMTDAVGQIVWINAALERCLGVAQAEVLGLDKRAFARDRLSRIVEDPASLVAGALGTSREETHALIHVLGTEARRERWLEHWACAAPSDRAAGGRIEFYVDVTHRVDARRGRLAARPGRAEAAPARGLYLFKSVRSA